MAAKPTASTKSSANQQKAAVYKQWADKLQRARRDKRLSVRKASQMANLPESTIRLLEHPKEDKLPKANEIGLYKLYASALEVELDTSQLKTKPKRATQAKNTANDAPIFSFKRAPKNKSMIVFSHIWVGSAISLVLIVVAGYFLWQGAGLFRTPDLQVDFPAQEFVKTTDSSLIFRGQADAESSVLINGDPVTVSSEGGHFSEVVYLQPGYNYVNVEAVNNFSTQSQQTFTVVYEN